MKIYGNPVATPLDPETVNKEVLGNLVVTLDLDKGTASHSSTEILNHLANGGSVVSKLSGDMDEYGHLWGAMDGEVAFSYIWVSISDTTQYIYTVRANKSIGLMESEMKPGPGGTVTDEQVADAVESYLEENPVQPGATQEQAAQIQANANALEALQAAVVGVSTVRSGQTVTLKLTLSDGGTETSVLTLDENDNPVGLTVNGTKIPWEWRGFDGT